MMRTCARQYLVTTYTVASETLSQARATKEKHPTPRRMYYKAPRARDPPGPGRQVARRPIIWARHARAGYHARHGAVLSLHTGGIALLWQSGLWASADAL